MPNLPAPPDADLAPWVGRTERRADRVTPVPLAALAATLDRDEPPPTEGSAIGPLRHWLYFLPLAPTRELGPDGHPRRGGFLPPVPLPRRMWAGGRLEFRRPLRVGDAIERRSTIASVETMQGKSDRRYVTAEEGYPGLVVHGPLIATLLADLARDRVVPSEGSAFSFRAVSPLFDVAPFAVCGKREADGGVRLWAQSADGQLAMEASATVR